MCNIFYNMQVYERVGKYFKKEKKIPEQCIDILRNIDNCKYRYIFGPNSEFSSLFALRIYSYMQILYNRHFQVTEELFHV